MFDPEDSQNGENKSQFEAGFNQNGNIIVKINERINSNSIILLIAIMDDRTEKFYNINDKNEKCNVICIFDSYGDDFCCVTTFYNYMKNNFTKYPKITYTGVLEYAEGNSALMYMLLQERVVKSGESAKTNTGIAKIGQSALKFTFVDTQFKNEIAKYLIENKIKTELLKLCFPSSEELPIQYCGNIIYDDGFGTKLQ